MTWVWVPQHTTPPPHTNFFLLCVCAVGVIAWCEHGDLRNPLLIHAGCVITTNGVFFYSYLF
jgi:hypothetical protein